MSLISSLLAFRCMICNRRLKSYGLCEWCKPKQYRCQNKNYCKTCMIEVSQMKDYCELCRWHPPLYSNIRHYWEYDIQSRNILKEVKYKNNEALLKLITREFIFQIEKLYLTSKFDFIIPMPESYKTSKKRNYNPCNYLAKKIAKQLNVSLINIIKKRRNVKPQASLIDADRFKNIKNAFYIKRNKIENKKLLVIDDVITSGASLMEITKLCLSKNATSISFLALARSPSWYQNRYLLELKLKNKIKY